MNKISRKILAMAAIAVFSSAAIAQVISVPQVTTVGPTDLFQDVVGGQPKVSSSYVSGATLLGQISREGNFLIGGDAGQNLWQRGTTGPSTTTTYLYNADAWFGWSGTSTAMTVSRDTTAAALPTGTLYDFKMQRTAAQTGNVQMCQSQVVRSLPAAMLAGHTAEFDFNVYTGANFSATSINAYITYGTGTDEGAQKLAYGLNAGGGGSTAWTGQANATTGTFSGMTTSSSYRVAAVGYIPSTATEVAVSVCYTPTGTAGTTDAIYMSNLMLRKADHLSTFANATTAYNVNLTTGNINIPASFSGFPAKQTSTAQNAIIPAFVRRNDQDEYNQQYARFWLIPESATSGVAQSSAGIATTTTNCSIQFQFPASMWKTPTLLGASTTNGYAALANTTFKIMGGGAAVALASTYAGLATGGTNATDAVVNFTNTSTLTQYAACQLISANGGGYIAFTADE
jgi:hypothetical protein